MIEIDRITVVNVGGTLYARIPKFMKREHDVEAGDELVYSKSSDNSDPIVTVSKKETESLAEKKVS